MKRIYFFLIVFLLTGFALLAQFPTTGWNTANFGMAVNISTNHEFHIGDKITVTHNNIPCGIGRYQDQDFTPNFVVMNIAFPVWGYTPLFPWLPIWGGPLTYTFYDTLFNQSYSIQHIHWVINTQWPNVYYQNGYNYHIDNIYCPDTMIFNAQRIDLIEGWSMIGTYIYPQIPLLAILPSSVILIKDDQGLVCIPSTGLNLMGNFWPGKGYLIKTSVADTFCPTKSAIAI